MKETRKESSRYHVETLAIHAGQEPDPATGAIMTPIYLTSTYVQTAPGKHKGYEYSRTRNPTRTVLEANLAALEGGEYGLAFASGCAALATIMHLFKSGDQIICCDDVYGGTYRLFEKVLKETHGLEVTFIDMTEPKNLEKALKKKSAALWIETPTNPLLKLIDLQKVIRWGREKKLLTCVDNTFMSPIFQRPLEFGADLVMHSTTKYLNGHSDVIGGAVITNSTDIYERLRFLQNAIGAIPGPMDSWLVLRGTKTLAVRMERHAANALKIAAFLEKHPAVEKVIYPGLKSHPHHELAKRQMHGFGGMISFVVKEGKEKAIEVTKKTKLFALAESLGGVESLIEIPAIMTHASIPEETREKLGIRGGLIRLSVGIEHVDDLIADLNDALA